MAGDGHDGEVVVSADAQIVYGTVEWKDGKKHGQGILICYDGAMYEGEWKEGKPNGQGTETWPNGKKYEGEWKNGERSKGTKYNKYGKIIGKFENGKWIKE